MEVVFNYVIESLLLPPGGPLLLMVLGFLVLRRRWPRLAGGLGWSGVALLYLLSLPAVALALMRLSEAGVRPLDPVDAGTHDAGAIVVLGAGRYPAAPEYGGDTVSQRELMRLRYGVELARRTHLPVLVSGGRTYAQAQSEAELMSATLQSAFGLKPRWLETKSRNTWENARYSSALLEAAGIQRILLVTDAADIPRAAAAFRSNGMSVVPAPTGFATQDPQFPWPMQLLPRAGALESSYHAGHELLGRLWYALRY